MEIDHPIMFCKADKAINKLKPGKAPGLNGIPPSEAYNKAFRKKMRMPSSLMAPMTRMDGTRANVSLYQRRVILLTPSNGEALRSWMSPAKFSLRL